MDEENHQTSRSPSGSSPTDEPAVPRPAESQGGSAVVYYGDAARVREGFVIALGLLGLDAGVDGVSCNQAEDGE